MLFGRMMRHPVLPWVLAVLMLYGALWVAAFSGAAPPDPTIRVALYAVLGFALAGWIARWVPHQGLAAWRMLTVGTGAGLAAAEVWYWRGEFVAADWMGSLAGLVGIAIVMRVIPGHWARTWFGGDLRSPEE